MAEFASKGVAGAGLGLGIAGTALGIMNGGLNGGMGGCGGGLFGGVRGVGCCSENTPATRYDVTQSEIMANKDMEIAYLRGQNATNDKLAALSDRVIARFERVESELRDIAVYQATNTATIGCLGNQVSQLQNLLGSLTKTIIPITNVCPEPMAKCSCA